MIKNERKTSISLKEILIGLLTFPAPEWKWVMIPHISFFTVSCKQLGDQPSWSCSQSQQISVAKIISNMWKPHQPFRDKRINSPQDFLLVPDSLVMLRRQGLVPELPTVWRAQPPGTAPAVSVRSKSASRSPQGIEWSVGAGGWKREHLTYVCIYCKQKDGMLRKISRKHLHWSNLKPSQLHREIII